ncbi:MAG: hypothetical protein GEU93_10580 [Propionibacteriales bacterium]|nr:hypothetical protein [Propionibacteriales bacterium]
MTPLLIAAQVDPEKVKPGWLGLFVVLALCLVTLLLWLSMNRQLKKVDFDDKSSDEHDETDTETDTETEDRSNERSAGGDSTD